MIGLASTGLHSNGYSLVRKVFRPEEIKGKLGAELLRPTRIYTRPILDVLKKIPIKAMAHITGGGFYDNIPRVIPEGLGVRIKKGSWTIPRIFHLIQERGKIGEREMFYTFNMGVGMVVVVSAGDALKTVQLFRRLGQKAWIIGDLREGRKEVRI